ncbi:MAG: hypothetical protein LBS41_02190 [Streptococcaceae bacterium]|jgi:hypothetical protein|nr:hypothetical protein [Streptococcaceae bacterium]
MSKKKKKTAYKEKTIALKDAEKLTVEEVATKSHKIAADNLNQESSLDKYIRQHRSQIETVKKERKEKKLAAAAALDDLVKTARASAEVAEEPQVTDAVSDASETTEAEAIKSTEATATTEVTDLAPDDSVSSSNDTPDAETSETPIQPEQAEIEQSEQASTPSSPVALDSDSEVQVTSDVSEAVEPDFPEVHGSFDTVVLAADEAAVQASPDTTEAADTVDAAVAPETFSGKSRTDKTVLKSDEISDNDDEAGTSSRKYQKPLIIGACALLLLSAGGLVWHNVDQANQKQAAKTAKDKAQKSEEAKKTAAFKQSYAAFFTDKKQTKLKNDHFAQIDQLSKELAKLSGQADYASLKAKVTALKADISAIQAMNANFDKAVIVDGVLDQTAHVRDGAKLSYTATENDTLNTLLKAAVTHGQEQQKAATSAAVASSAAAANAVNAGNQTAQSTTAAGASQAPATTATGSGLTTAQYQAQYPAVALNTSLSRVPVDPHANLADSAFAWEAGIKELVLQKCRERGYISGDAYILLPASIQKGNGYYNLYRPDGFYLVSINCKTGYFVGNGAGHADDLDY